MKTESAESYLKLFNMSCQYILHDLNEIQEKRSLQSLVESQFSDNGEDQYYPQFDQVIKDEAKIMGYYYRIFYCLERSIRKLIAETIESIDGPNWWDPNHIPESIIQNVESVIKKEKDSGLTRRSDFNIDYTNFGELGEIIKKNWTIFGSIFNSQRAVEKVINTLNMLRNNIAHCCPLSEDEMIRLKLSVKDWFRLME